MVKHKTYEKYKSSGIDWLGDVPEHWDVIKLGYRANMIVPMRDKPTEFDGDVPWIRIEDFDGKYISDSKSEQRVSKQLIDSMNLKVYPAGTVLCSCSCRMGVTAITTQPLISNQTFIGIVPGPQVNSDFLFYVMNAFSGQLQIIATSAIQQYLSREDFQNFKIALPEPSEQQTIADFLDRETGRIDALIDKKRQFIKRLAEKRTALISRAVTMGLDPAVKLKPSGIDWLGDVPEHWDTKKIKYLTIKIGSGITPKGGATVYQDDGVPLLRSQNIHFDSLRMDDVAYIDESIHSEMKNSQVHPGDVLLNITGASIGRCFYWSGEFKEANVNQHVCILRPANNCLTKFLYYLLRSEIGQAQIQNAQTGSGREGLNFETIKHFLVGLPKIEEQGAIVAYLDNETGKIDHLVDKVKQAIEKLQEYRSAIISAAVTGKIDVRETG